MNDTLTLGTTSIAGDLRLKPQARRILGHMLKGLSITPMQAMTVYTISRLAPCINEIRNAGYCVVTHMRQDAQGHGYASYVLIYAKFKPWSA